MKKLVTISAVAFLLVVTSCKSDAKNDEKKDAKETEVKKEAAAFSVANAKNDIKFTAYKTTEKVGVGGEFKKVAITSGGEGNSVKEAINGAIFSIPINSLATKDSSRDYKIQKFFFGVMTATEAITGRLQLTDDTNGIAKITMNGETKDVPFTYIIKDKTFNMQGVIDINAWNAGAALAKLNEVCKVLHTGADGVSKTWSEVALNITSTF